MTIIHLDRDYHLKFGTKALRLFERDLGKSAAILEDPSQIGIDVLVCMLHAGMCYAHPEVTLDDLDGILDGFIEGGGKLDDVIEQVLKAAMESAWMSNPTQAVSPTASPSTPTISGSTDAPSTTSHPLMSTPSPTPTPEGSETS